MGMKSMDWILLIKAAIMGVVEGVTEFLPISSTGHLILTAALLEMPGEKIKLFEIVIQTGAILAIVSLYTSRLWGTLRGLSHDRVAQRFAVNVSLGFFPAALAGFFLIGLIKSVLFNPVVVAIGFMGGGLVILWAEHRYKKRAVQGGAEHPDHTPLVHSVDALHWSQALKVGLVQCAALVPGVSRSGATIIGGMLLGIERRAATEFSFFLAIPTLFGAAAYDLYKHGHLLSTNDLGFFAVGLLMSWLSAWVCVRWLLRFVSTHTFVPFAWYRIAFGGLILLTAGMGWVDWAA